MSDTDAQNFPQDDSLCERCGYALHSLKLEADCPECGHPVAMSSPDRRPGLPWQNTRTLGAWSKTVIAILLWPRKSFTKLRVTDRPDPQARAFLFTLTLLIGFGWTGLWVLAHLKHAWLWGLAGGLGVALLTYIEIGGVTFFSHKRGWRVPFHRAEQIACYAAVGWLPAALVTAKVALAVETQALIRHRLWPMRLLGPLTPEIGALLIFLAAAVSLLWFETLVWTGVRTLKFANPTSE